MRDLLPAVEKNAREILHMAARVLGILAAAESIPKPALYLRVIGDLSKLRPLWSEHMRLLSQAYPLMLSESDGMAIAVLRQFEQDIADTAHWLEALTSAGWARSPDIGVNCVHLRATQTLTNILRQMDKERTTVVPLFRRHKVQPSRAKALVKQMATA